MGYIAGFTGTGMLRSMKFGNMAGDNEEASTMAAAETDTGAKAIIGNNDVVVFVSSSCPYCVMATQALTEAKIPHTVVERTEQQARELFQMTGKSSVPSAWVKGQYIGGCNDGPEAWMGVIPCVHSGRIERMLKE